MTAIEDCGQDYDEDYDEDSEIRLRTAIEDCD